MGKGPRSVTITRAPFYFPPLSSKVLPGGVGYVRLADFVLTRATLPDGTEILADLDRRLADLDAQGAQSLILDLRNNGGGSVQTADELLGRFLPETTRSVRESDERGHVTYELDGWSHARSTAAHGGADQWRLRFGVGDHGQRVARCASSPAGGTTHGGRARLVRAAAAAWRCWPAGRRGCRGDSARPTRLWTGRRHTGHRRRPAAHARRLSHRARSAD